MVSFVEFKTTFVTDPPELFSEDSISKWFLFESLEGIGKNLLFWGKDHVY